MKKSVTLCGRFVAAAETQNDAESLTDAGSGVVSPETICIYDSNITKHAGRFSVGCIYIYIHLYSPNKW